jgi:UDP-N-acetylglucosamine:LPS N-acetylglucosamine transferase
LADNGCAVVVPSDDHTQERCLQAIATLLQDEGQRRVLEERCDVLRTPSAEKNIVDVLLGLR